MRQMMRFLIHPKTAGLAVILGILLCVGLLGNALVFHVLSEFTTVVLGFSVFIMVLSAREHIPGPWLPVLSSSLFFSSALDLLHALSRPESGVLQLSPHASSQFWIWARAVQCIGALAVPLIKDRRFPFPAVFSFFALLSGAAVAFVFGESSLLAPPPAEVWDVFLTFAGPVLAAGFGCSILLVRRAGPWSPPSIQSPLTGHAGLMVLSCLTLPGHEEVITTAQIVGQLATVGAFACAYAACTTLAFDQPMATLIGSLRRREEELSARNQGLLRQNRAITRLTKHHALTGPDLQGAMRLITQGASAVVGGGRLAVAVLDETQGALVPLDVLEGGNHRTSAPVSLVACPGLLDTLGTSRFISSDDQEHSLLLSCLSQGIFGAPSQALSAAGIRREGRPVGLILHAAGRGGPLDLDGQVFLASLADLAALSLESHDRRTENAARLVSEERLAALVQALPDQVCFKDTKGRWLVANPAWLTAHGVSASGYQGMTGESRDPRLDLDGTLTALRLKTDAAAWTLGRIEYCILNETPGGVQALELLKMALGPARAPKGLMVLARDVSSHRDTLLELMHSHKELAEVTRQLTSLNEGLEGRIQDQTEENRRKDALIMQQSRMAAMGEMIGNIAHQWRQPLNALGLLVSNLTLDALDGTLDERQAREYDARCKEILKLMSRTIDDFRNFFKPDKAKQRFQLRESVLEALTLVEASLAQHGIVLVKNLDADVEVEGFKGELAQVMLNLLANARDALAGQGRRRGRISVDIARSGGMGRVTVADDGGGIPPDIQESLFKPYFTTKVQDKGTGLGLYMSKRIIEDHMGGSIRFANSDTGAVFTVEIPALSPLPGPEQP